MQYGTADSADFEKNTWTFQMDGNYRVHAGRFAILTESEFHRLLELAREGDAKL
ncbi:MAG: hypothetical protein KKC18_08070 [Chloroflexi bacterium]|nr:hypothetical protein [Chloroflexota bacterium]